MPYKTGKLKGELTTPEIRKLIRAHNVLVSITIPKGAKREDIMALVKKNGYMVDHEKQSLRPVSKGKVKKLPVVDMKKAEKTLPKPKTKEEKAAAKKERDMKKKDKEDKIKAEGVKQGAALQRVISKRKVKKVEPKIDKKQIDKLSLEYIKEIEKMSPLKTLAEIQSTFKKYKKKIYDFIGTNVDNYEELREYWDDNWSDKISKSIPDGRKKEAPKKDEKSPPPLRFSGSKSKIDKIKSKVKKGKISVEEGLKEWKIDIEAYERRRKASEKSLIKKGYKSGGVVELKALEKEGIEIIKNAKK